MLMLRLLNYYKGSVKIRIAGAIPEKFINLCIAQRIFLWGIQTDGRALNAWIRLPDFFAIRPVVRRSETHITVLRHAGMPFVVKRMKSRKMLVAGAITCFIALQVLASYIWVVDIIGVKTLKPDRVRSIAIECGLMPAIRKESVNTKELEKKIMLKLPEAAWVGVSFHGTRAVVEIVEKTVPNPEDKRPAHIVAGKNGLVEEIIVVAGQAAVKKGDTIKKGDLLIKGFIPENPPPASGAASLITIPPKLIRANGIIRAHVWYESYGEAELVLVHRVRTGQKQMSAQLQMGGQELKVNETGKPFFGEYDTEVIHKKMPGWRNSGLVVESTITIYHEIEVQYESISPDAARDKAKNKALEAVQAQIPENAEMLSRTVEVIKTNETGIVRVKANVETIEDIGEWVNIQ